MREDAKSFSCHLGWGQPRVISGGLSQDSSSLLQKKKMTSPAAVSWLFFVPFW